MRWRRVGATAFGIGGLGVAGLVGAPVGFPVSVSDAATPTCTSAGSTGLTAAVVATAGQTISAQTIDATGCDVGIYVGPGITGVTIGGTSAADAVTVSGANDIGVFGEDTSGITVENATVEGNGVNLNPKLASFGGIVLAGVSTSTVTDNTLTDNGGGGVLLNDDGPVDPGAPDPGPSAPVAATNDTITQNTISGNYGACGIVLATHDSGGTISGINVSGNTITGHVGVVKATGPDVGGIVVAAASAGATVSNISVTGNNVSKSWEAGVIVHAHAPMDVVTGVSITGNTLGPENNWGDQNGPTATVGVIVGVDQLPPAIAPSIKQTTVAGNTIFGQYYGLWTSGVTGVATSPANNISVTPGGTPIFSTPAPGQGYWTAAKDGGVFTYGDAGFYGSAGNLKLNKPVVGMAATQDQGGYWLVGSDGGVFTYGDANFFGSAGDLKLTQPVVGIASTPYVPVGAVANPSGNGYWLVAADGGIFNYGDAGFFGSAGNLKLTQPVVGMAPTPDGKGYWLVAADGGIFTYGDAGFFGSTGNLKLNQPIVGMAPTPDGKGYWLVGADGGVFSFGDAGFFGSAGSLKLSQPIVSIAASPDGKGYQLVAADGGVFDYGDAGFFGSAGNLKLNQPIVGSSSVGTTFSG